MSGGRGFVKLAPHVRLVSHRLCAYCQKLGPACQCGVPAWKRPRPRTKGDKG